MGKSLFDFDDIQAAENRRKEVAVLAGASPRAERYADSPLKQMKVEYFKEMRTKVQDKVEEYVESHPLPGYNFVSGVTEEEQAKSAKEAKEAAEVQQNLMEEANANEYKVTDTSTGLPKAEPVLTDDEREAQALLAKRAKAQREKEAAHVAPVVVVKPAEPTKK